MSCKWRSKVGTKNTASSHQYIQELNQLKSLRNPQIHPPERMGNVRLSSRSPRSNASAIPVTRPETTLTAAKPSHPLVGKPEKQASCSIAFTPCPKGLWSTPGPDTPYVQSQVGSTPPTAGTIQLQKEKTIAAPVREAARKPAMDFRGASGSPRMGMRGGSGGVREPHMPECGSGGVRPRKDQDRQYSDI